MQDAKNQHDWPEIAALIQRLRSFRRCPVAYAALAEQIAQALAHAVAQGTEQSSAELVAVRARLQAEISFATQAARLRDPASIMGAK